jgi:Flp pilus assembly pilin Flp
MLRLNEDGASVVEYAIILAFVVVLAIAAIVLIGMETTAKVADPELSGAFM